MKFELIGLRQDLSLRHDLARIREKTVEVPRVHEKASFGPGWIIIAGISLWIAIIVVEAVRYSQRTSPPQEVQAQMPEQTR